jgi:ribosomal protein L9
MVKLEGMIKLCGLYEVDLNLGYDIMAKVKVMVVPQKADKK